MLTDLQRQTFADRGILHLPGLIPGQHLEASRQVIWRCLQEAGVYEDGDGAPGRACELIWPTSGSQFVKRVSKSRHFREVMTDELLAAVDQLLDGEPASSMMDRPQLLFTLPNASTWTVPHNIWHLDMPRVSSGEMSGVQAFVCVDAVPAGGGGTLVVAGSHRFCNQAGQWLSSKDVKRRLKRVEYFKMLMNRETPGRDQLVGARWLVDDIPVEVVELCGAPGDVYLTDMRILHTLAPNTARHPRIVLTQRFLLNSAQEEVIGKYQGKADRTASGPCCSP